MAKSSPTSPWNSGSTEASGATQFLEERADEAGIKLPPLGKTPKRWPKMLQAPKGPPLFYGTTQKGFLLAVMKACRGPIIV